MVYRGLLTTELLILFFKSFLLRIDILQLRLKARQIGLLPIHIDLMVKTFVLCRYGQG